MYKKDKYKIIRNAISKEKANFLYKYFKLKKQVAKTMLEHNWMSPYATEWGCWNDPQIKNTYIIYGDPAFDLLLEELKPILSKETALELVEQYSFARLYKKGDELKRHKDRLSCEITVTLNLGGNLWPIFIETDPTKGKKDFYGYKSDYTKGTQVDLGPGDLVVYDGINLEHWREPFEGDICGQVFLHYNTLESSIKYSNKFDNRPHLGLPDDFCSKRLYKYDDKKEIISDKLKNNI